MATRIFAAYNAYLALVRGALPTLDAVGAVYDGPQIASTTSKDVVIVGCSNPLDTGMTLAVDTGQQDWVAVAPPSQPRDESFAIYSTYVAWTGSNDLAGCRARADTNISAIETAVRANPLLSGGLTAPGWSSLSVVSLEQVQDPSGAALHVLFALVCHA